MPSIASRIRPAPKPVEHIPTFSAPRPAPPLNPPAPILSSILRCPMPIVGPSSNPDNLRQFYAGGVLPQYRFQPPSPLS